MKTITQTIIKHLQNPTAAVFCLALLVRIVYVVAAGSAYQLDAGDQAAYDTIARNWVEGNGFMQGSSYRSPLYPFFLGSIYFISGPHIIIAKLFQALLGALACLLVMAIASRLFNRRISIIAGLLVTAMPVLIHYTSQLMTETLFATLLLTAVYVLVTNRHNLTWRQMGVTGILIGLCTLCRANTLLLSLILPVWLYSGCRYRVKKITQSTAICALGTILTIAPWTIRNYRVHDAFILISTNGGVNLWIGNNPYATGDWIEPSDFRVQSTSSEYQTDREYYKDAFAFLKKYPRRSLTLAIKKFIILWSPYPHPLDRIPFWMLTGTAVVGLVITYRNKMTYILCIILAYYSFLSCLFFANQRFHVPLLYLVACYAACGADLIFRARRGAARILAFKTRGNAKNGEIDNARRGSV